MSAVLEAREPSARYLVAEQPALVRQFELLATAQGAVSRLRELILGLAVQGKLVHQDARDEPASALLERIAGERARLIAAGKLRQSKDPTAEDAPEPPYSLPRGWTWSRLASIGVINPRNDAADDVEASFVQMSSIPVAFNDLHETEARPWRDIKSGFTQFAEGDVGVAKITPCFENGKSTVFQNLSNGIGAGTTELHVVRPLCGVAPRYVLLFLKSPRFLREGEATMTGTAGQKRLPRSFFENCPFPLPPLAEQARIVARVDELIRLCDALEAKGRLEAEQHARLLGTLLGTLTDSSTPEELAANWQRVADHFDLLLDRPEAIDALEQTVLQLAVRGLLVPQDPSDEPATELMRRIRSYRDEQVKLGLAKRERPYTPLSEADYPFELPNGWEWIRFDELIEPAKPISYGVLVPGPDVDRGVPFVRIADLSLTDPPAKPEKSISKEVDAQYQRTRLQGGEILMGVVGSIGKLGVAPRSWAGANIARAICRIVPVGLVDYGFVLLLLQSEFMRDSFAGDTRTLAQPTLNVGLIRSSPTPLPPLAEQARIVARVTEIRRLSADLRQSLDRSSTTQASLADALIEQALSA